MINRLLSYLRLRKQDIKLARPTTIKMGEGEVILKNLPKEEVDRIKALLTGEPNIASVESELKMTLETADVKELNYTAIGFRQNNAGFYELVSVKYNVDSKQAAVESVTSLGQDKHLAVHDLKVKMSKLV